MGEASLSSKPQALNLGFSFGIRAAGCESGGCLDIRDFPKLVVLLGGVAMIRIMIFWWFLLESPYFGKLPFLQGYTVTTSRSSGLEARSFALSLSRTSQCSSLLVCVWRWG